MMDSLHHQSEMKKHEEGGGGGYTDRISDLLSLMSCILGIIRKTSLSVMEYSREEEEGITHLLTPQQRMMKYSRRERKVRRRQKISQHDS